MKHGQIHKANTQPWASFYLRVWILDRIRKASEQPSRDDDKSNHFRPKVVMGHVSKDGSEPPA